MVSLNDRNKFIAELHNEPSTHFAFALVFESDCFCKTETAVTVADRAARAIVKGDQAAFAEVVEELNRRKVKPDVDWVLDDFLLFALLVGAKKYHVGEALCNAIINARRPADEMDTALNGAFRSLSLNAYTIEGEFSFVKLVFCDLIGQLHIDTTVAGTVYAELTDTDLFAKLENFPKLLAYRAFDLLVQHGIEDNLDSMDTIVSAIESRSSDMSLRDWLKIALAMRPSVLVWIGTALFALSSLCFSAGLWFGSFDKSKSTQSIRSSTISESDNINTGKEASK